ncbi:MAG: NAD(P)/FAD-dependent oxidoreductase [Pseudomonadota bacterium]
MREEIFETDIVVIGAGVIGLATARAIALAHPKREVIVLEAEPAIAVHTSSRNSEVIHAGLYYAAGSLKARHCVGGRRALTAYLSDHGIDQNICGKLVVATDDEEASALEELLQRARGNGVEGLSLIDGKAARDMEPALSSQTRGALVSSVSGIFDSHSYFLALQGDLEDAGGQVVLSSPIETGVATTSGLTLSIGGETPSRLKAKWVVNAAGHHAVDLAMRIEGPHCQHLPTPRYVKGSYFTISGKTPFSRLIYPMPTRSSLGLHLTIDLGGRGKLGPDAEWLPAGAAPPFDYRVDAARAEHFYASVRRYWPSLPDGALAPDYAGVRPKLVNEGEPSGDFRIEGPDTHGTAGLINLLGIESPGLTSSLAIADHVAALID